LKSAMAAHDGKAVCEILAPDFDSGGCFRGRRKMSQYDDFI
jgi:hypothetical protein